MSVRVIGEVGVRMRVNVGEEKRTAYVDVELDGRTATLTQGAARALVAGVEQMLQVAEKFDAEQLARHGAPEPPTLSYSSDLTLTVDVVHDDDRDELLSVVAARIETILEREGADCWGWSLKAEPNARERLAEGPGAPDTEV